MTKVCTITEPYFSHDLNTRETLEIKRLIHNNGYEGYGVFWAVVEFMHRNELPVGDEYLVINEEYADKVRKVLNEYKLFYVKDGCYVSDRILRNISKQEEKSKKAKNAVALRWLLSKFSDEYEKVFGIKPSLSDSGIEAIKTYSKKIADFEKKLPQIFKVLSGIKFDTKSGFKPRVDWLLTGDNLYQIVNGQYGDLAKAQTKPQKSQLDMSTEQEQWKERANGCNVDTISGKAAALEIILKGNWERSLWEVHKLLIDKFEITKEELTANWEKYNA